MIAVVQRSRRGKIRSFPSMVVAARLLVVDTRHNDRLDRVLKAYRIDGEHELAGGHCLLLTRYNTHERLAEAEICSVGEASTITFGLKWRSFHLILSLSLIAHAQPSLVDCNQDGLKF